MMNQIRTVDFRKLEALRLDQGLAKTAFCRKAGISGVTYHRLRNRKWVMDPVIIKMAKALGVKPSEIICWEDEPR